jgi:hypothetical protein
VTPYLVALLVLAPPGAGVSGADTEETAERLLGTARDAGQPDGVRGQALVSYARLSARRKTGAEAAPAIWALKGRIGGGADPVFEALGALGPPALPTLAEPLRRCGAREPRKGRLTDAKAASELDESQMAVSVLVALVREHNAAPEALALAPDLVRGLACGDASVRQLCARALGALSRVEPREVAAVRKKLTTDRRPDVRALSAAILAAVSARDAASVKALERALGDPAERVQLSSANALMQLKKPDRARGALERLQRSADPEIAGLAAGVLRTYPPAAP